MLAATILGGCRSRARANPATIYQDIRSDFLHGNFNTAQTKAELARNEFSASGSDWPMKFRLLEAEVLIYRGHRQEVIALLTSPEVTYPIAGDLAISRDLLCGVAHSSLGQAEKADGELQEARRLSDASDSVLNGEVLRTEGVVELHREHLSEARDLFNQSLIVARDRHNTFLEAEDLLNLGLVAIGRRHYDEALALLSGATSLARPIQAQAILEWSSGNLGDAYFHLGDWERALSVFSLAEQQAAKTGSTSAQVVWAINVASCYYMLGNLQAAKTSFEQSLKAAVAIDAPKEVADIETHLAFVLYRQGQFVLATTHNERAIQAARRAGAKPEELEALYLQALLASHQENGQKPELMLLQAHEKSDQDPSLRGQLENALASLYASRHQAKQADLWFRKSIRTFEDQRAELGDEELELPFFANGDTLYRDYADFLIASHKQEQALQLLDISRAKTLADGLGRPTQHLTTEPTEAQMVAGKLDGTILFYSLGMEKSYLWAITTHRTKLFVLPGQPAIEAQLNAYKRAILKSNDPLQESNQAAKDLYQILVGPVAAIPKGSRVFVVTDGILNGLNFETLLTPGPGSTHYWIDDVIITNAHSIRLLSAPHAPADYARKLLLIGNPVTDGTGYETLVNAFSEGQRIEKQFAPDSRTVVTQSGAVPAAYADSHPEKFEYIHFVAHGTASELSPLDSAVVLSPPPNNPDQFKLYARDIMRFPVHARLVTVSACYGSGSRSYAGEGLVGLSWAFLRAGSHNVIAALWEVNDASTPLLMDRLYGELKAGHTPDVALREAKLSLIHSSAVYRKPLYWGAFQLYSGS